MRLACVCATLVLLHSGCAKKADPKPQPVPRTFASGAFHPYDSTRIIMDSVHADLDNDGISEFVLTSRAAVTGPDQLDSFTFDRLEVFRYDSTRALYTSLFIDPVENGTGMSFQDVTHRGMMEIVVKTGSGGNDPISSTGVCIYGRRQDGTFTVLFVETSGAPELRDLNGDHIPELIIRDEYWGVMSHDEAIEYTSEVHAFNGNEFVESNLKFGGYFDAEIARRRADYQQIKTRKGTPSDAAFNTYRAFTDLMLWLISKGDLYEVRKVWTSEKRFLSQRLAQDQFDDIDGLVQDALAEQQQASLGGEWL